MNITNTWQHVHSLVDPVAQAVAHAPVEDQPFTEGDRQAVAEAEQWRKHNDPIPLETVLADFGLAMSDWKEMGKAPLPEECGKRVLFTEQARADIRAIQQQIASSEGNVKRLQGIDLPLLRLRT